MDLDEVDTIDISEFAENPSGPIFLDNTQCSGEENGLLLCGHDMVHMCSHNNDIGIICHRKLSHSVVMGNLSDDLSYSC